MFKQIWCSDRLVRLDQVFDENKSTVFPCPGIVFHDHWGCPMTIYGNAREFQYHIRQFFPFCTWIVARGDSHQTNPEAVLIHWFTTSTCVYITGLMNIQGEHSGGYISRWMAKIIVKIASFHTLHNYLFWSFRITIFSQTDSFCHSLQVGMFCIIVSISATGLFGYLEVDLGVIVGSYWIHLLSLSQVFGVFRLALAID